MDEMLHVVKDITIFALLFSIVSNLFAKSKYQKYFDFVQGLILIGLVMAPLFSWLGSEHVLDDSLQADMFRIEEDSYKEELEMIGEQREQILWQGLKEGGEQKTDE